MNIFIIIVNKQSNGKHVYDDVLPTLGVEIMLSKKNKYH